MTVDLKPTAQRHILFLSPLDFKEKSIQVVRKTPEAYSKAGWSVNYVVVSDPVDVFFYERTINPPGIHVHRISKSERRDPPINFLKPIIWKIRRLTDAITLARYSRSIIKDNIPDVIYGYEVYGTIAAMILKYIYRLKGPVYITRYQGTHLYSHLQQQRYGKILLNADHVLAMMLPSDLCIMTNDGTNGDRWLRAIRSPNAKRLKFWLNGVDEKKHPHITKNELRSQAAVPADYPILLSISRLVKWKRVDRGLEIAERLIKDYKITNLRYWIIGDGPERENLVRIVNAKGITENVCFLGAIPHKDIWKYFRMSDVFISMYDSSNVGNPLLEAIREHKIIVTLNNGDTRRWIHHKKNGFIYDINEDLFHNAAHDISQILSNTELRDSIEHSIKQTESLLWDWDSRLTAEVQSVEDLLRRQ